MTAKSHIRGHEIEFINNEWFYCDTKESTDKDRSCNHCGMFITPEGHDACLGTLPGLMNACCGHGLESESYVQFLDGFGVRGKDAITIMEILKSKCNVRNSL